MKCTGEVASAEAGAGSYHLYRKVCGGEQLRRVMQPDLLNESHGTAPESGDERACKVRPAHTRDLPEGGDAVGGSGLLKHMENGAP